MAIGNKNTKPADTSEDVDLDPPGAKGKKVETEFQWDFENITPLAPCPEGEYEVHIDGSEHKKSKSSEAEYFNLRCSLVEDGGSVPDIYWMVSTPIPSDTPKQRNGKMTRLMALLDACNIDKTSRVKPSDFVGHTVTVKIKQSFDNKGELRNEIVGLVTPAVEG